MVPPFLAYYGVLNSNESMIDEAYNQCKLYRQYLKDDDANGLWMHIVEGQQFSDRGHWSTGNGWAAAGMLRVLATIQNSPYQDSHQSQISDLRDWTNEIHDAMYDVLDDTNIFRNYADNESTFYDAASTALLASSVYRISLLQGQHQHAARAERSRKAIADSDNNHLDGSGWLQPVVNPHNFGNEGSESAEAQAFVLMMQASWQEWVAAGSQGSGALVLRPSMAGLGAWLVFIVGAFLLV
jgi:rhamnogalacturonyl hydrolase YesR